MRKHTLKTNSPSHKSRIIIVFYFFTCILGIIGLYVSDFVPTEYRFLFIGSSTLGAYSVDSSGWMRGSWEAVLEIHGTIVALAITFMEMLVNQVAANLKHGFENILRSFIIKRIKFVEFNVNSICSLVVGIIFLSFNFGFIAYVFSVVNSIYFIIRYGLMAYKVHYIGENPDSISHHFFHHLDTVKKEFITIVDEANKLKARLTRDINTLNNIVIKENNITSFKDVLIDMFAHIPNLYIRKYEFSELKNLDEKLSTLNAGNGLHIGIIFENSTIPNKIIVSINHLEIKKVREDITSEIRDAIIRCFYISPPVAVYNTFSKLENALVSNLKNSLLTGNEQELNFGIDVIKKLVLSVCFSNTLHKLKVSLIYDDHNRIDKEIFSSFYRKLFSIVLNEKISESKIVVEFAVDVARSIYTNSDFSQLYRRVFNHLEERVRYFHYEKNYSFWDIYLQIVKENVVSRYYDSFDCDTDFITNRLRYIDRNHNEDPLTDLQRKLLLTMKEIITCLIVRIVYLSKKENHDIIEIKKIKEYISLWINSAFIEDLYYKPETYELLLDVPDNYSIFDAIGKLKDVSDDETAWNSAKHDTYQALGVLLTRTSKNRSKFNLIYIIRDNELNSTISGQHIENIIECMYETSFTDIMQLCFGFEKQEYEESLYNTIARLKELKRKTDALMVNKIAASDLHNEQVNKYAKGMKLTIRKCLDKVINISQVVIVDDAIPTSTYYNIISKTLLLEPTGNSRCNMEQDIETSSADIVSHWVKDILSDSIDNKSGYTTEEISIHDELVSGKDIIINYEMSEDVIAYLSHRNVTLNLNKNDISLGQPGVYIINLNDFFFFKRNRNLANTHIIKINNKNAININTRFNIGEDIQLYAYMENTLQLEAVQSQPLVFKFIAKEQWFRFINCIG